MIKAVCACKMLNEDDLVVGVPIKRAIAKWGPGMWIVQLLIIIFTAGSWLSILIPYEIVKYFLDGKKYQCQFCGQVIDKRNFRS